jgi:hypothetical protein
MKKISISLILLMSLLYNTGCASYMAYDRWQTAKENDAVIIQANGQEVRVGVDLLALDYLKEEWPMAIGAAVVDGVLFYGTYKLYDNNFGSSGGGSSSDSSTDIRIQSESGRDTSIVINGGDGNMFGEQGDTTDTTTF